MELIRAGCRLYWETPSSGADREEVAFAEELLDAFALYRARNASRKGVWRRSGIKGQSMHVFAKAERAFQQTMAGDLPDEDHFRDTVVYSIFALLLLRSAAADPEAALDGEWPWNG